MYMYKTSNIHISRRHLHTSIMTVLYGDKHSYKLYQIKYNMWSSWPMWHNVCSNVLTYLIYSNIVLFIYSFIKCVINIYYSSYFRASFNPLTTNYNKWITLRNKSSISHKFTL